MVRGLDHIVWPARDLGALAETFQRLGFTVGRRNRHPWGTVNHVIQFDGSFLELLGFADDYRTPPADDPAQPFAGFCEAFLSATAGGAAMLVLRSDDAAADARAFATKGIGQGRMLPFSRAAQGPDGSDRTVSFTVAFADLPGLTGVGAFVCQPHRPENFWNPDAQRHANEASGIAGVNLATDAPAAAAASLRAFAGETHGQGTGTDVIVPLANGTIEIAGRAPIESKVKSTSRMTAVRITVADLWQAARVLDEAGISFASTDDRLTVQAAEAGGTDLVFCPRSA